ncbi:MAG: amino acid permease, partial [Saprospiraceae bacterium]|nr:amino acid permease [Saprospiraceae bacterium]
GIFTILGLQLQHIQEPLSILLLWLLGGLMALCGAVGYARLARYLPRSGGEYHFISRIYRPSLGFSAGMASVLVGFAAPLALTASAFGHYFQHLVSMPATALAVILLIITTAIHGLQAKTGGEIHFGITFLKIALILVFISLGFSVAPAPSSQWLPDFSLPGEMMRSEFALALIYTSFAYSGWNASCYILEEVRNPGVNIPRSLLLGSAIVTLLYLLLNFSFLVAVPRAQLAGEIEVAYNAGRALMGATGGQFVGLVISLALVTSVSALVVAGSRVYKTLAEDYPFLSVLSRENEGGAPVYALLLQSALALILLLTLTFESILTYTGFILIMYATLTVGGNLVLVWKREDFRLKWWEWSAVLFFILLNAGIAVYMVVDQPVTVVVSTGFAVAGVVAGKTVSHLRNLPDR